MFSRPHVENRHASFLTQVDDRLTERLAAWLGRRHGLQPFRSDGRAANTHCGESLRDQLPKEAFVHELQLLKPYLPDRIMRLDGVRNVSHGYLSLVAPYRPRAGQRKGKRRRGRTPMNYGPLGTVDFRTF